MFFCLAVAAGLLSFVQAGAPHSSAAPPTLTEGQKQMLKSAEADLAAKMAPLAAKIGDAAKNLNRAILADAPDPAAETKLSEDFAKAVSDLVSEAIRTRISAVRELVKSLSPEQKKILLAEVDKPGADADLVNIIKKAFEEKNK